MRGLPGYSKLPGYYKLTREPTPSWWLKVTHLIGTVLAFMALGVLVVTAALIGYFPHLVGRYLTEILWGIVGAVFLIWLYWWIREY